MIYEFFAVTLTSVYHVKDKGGSIYPVAVKIALKGSSEFPVGHELNGGTMIAICKGLIAYIPEGGGVTSQYMVKERRIEAVNTFYWGDGTSPIVALFGDEVSAQACFGNDDLKPCDPRWIESTKTILAEIGDNHPAFEVCHWQEMALLPS